MYFSVILCFLLLYLYFIMSLKWLQCVNRAGYSSPSHVLDSPFPRLWVYVAPLILAVLSLHVHVCCRFLFSRLLFLVVLCISIDILVFFQFHSAFWRCFYDSVCDQSVILCIHVCISRLVAFFVCFFGSFCSL